MLEDPLRKTVGWKSTLGLVTDAHGYFDAVQSAKDTGAPPDYAQLAKQFLTLSVAFAQTVGQEGVDTLCPEMKDDWVRRLRQLDAVLELMLVVGLFKPRAVRRSRRRLLQIAEDFEALFLENLPESPSKTYPEVARDLPVKPPAASPGSAKKVRKKVRKKTSKSNRIP